LLIYKVQSGKSIGTQRGQKTSTSKVHSLFSIEIWIFHSPPVVCVLFPFFGFCFRIVVSNTSCVVFLPSVYSSWVRYIASVTGLSIVGSPVKVLVLKEERKHLRQKYTVYFQLRYGYFIAVTRIVISTL
jgi:hypothetical protein